ncbi:O-antigen polymerase [Alcaligenes endophyticus]|uniref:Oligosaccharide repeat unit polymerase n=1 Tax=Alcaligenes endophyticus TaxID=1929088 RepID=A0ABT8EFU4_9BURK|nr:O-antigen polymerase [Alcaligenes endophyticus]MCX5590191.1 O-antigen ligase [Alcaligenes endophyticus]MDN4120146.1 oligosaccharide repeat unit polymerase [Alcaligenes endophyticus]
MDFAFLLIFLSTPIAIFFLLRLAGEQANKISLVNITTISLYFFSILGTFPLYYQLDEYRFATGVTDKSLVFLVLICSCVNVFFFLFGVIFTREIAGIKPLPFTSSEITKLTITRALSLFLSLLFVVLVLYIYLGKIEQVAIVAAFKDGASAATLARSKMGNDFAGSYHWYSLVLNNIGIIVTLTFYVSWLQSKRIIILMLFLVSFLISSFIAVMATEKAPFINLLMAIFMAHVLVRHDGKVPRKTLIQLFVLMFFVLIVFYIYFMGSASIWQAIGSIFSRAFSGSIQPAYHYLEYFPAHQEFMLGKSFPNPGGIMPFVPIPFTIDIMNWRFPEHIELGIVGTMPTVFWGEAYGNFGFLGIPAIAFIMGILVSFLSYFVSKIELNPVTISLSVWLIFHIKQISVTGFSGYLYDFYLIGVFLFIATVLFFDSKIKIRTAKLL